MKRVTDLTKYEAVLSRLELLEGVPASLRPQVFAFLCAEARRYRKGELIRRIGEPFPSFGVVLEGEVEVSFVGDRFDKITIDRFRPERSFGEALSCAGTRESPIQLEAVSACTVLFLNPEMILSEEPCRCLWRRRLSVNLIRILAKQNVFSNLKLRLANQKGLRARILLYLATLPKDQTGAIQIPFSQTTLAEFLGVNRSALAREFSRMKQEGLIETSNRGKTIRQ